MEFTKLSSPSLKDLFVQQLQGMILSGSLPVGAQLPPERVLAEQMRVSRTVVNGGLAELSDQGFLEVHPRQGTFVADYRRRGNLSTLIAIMQYKGGVLGRDEIRSILEVRRALEHLAAERAIRYASDEALDRLGSALAQIAAASGAEQAAESAFDFQCDRTGYLRNRDKAGQAGETEENQRKETGTARNKAGKCDFRNSFSVILGRNGVDGGRRLFYAQGPLEAACRRRRGVADIDPAEQENPRKTA